MKRLALTLVFAACASSQAVETPSVPVEGASDPSPIAMSTGEKRSDPNSKAKPIVAEANRLADVHPDNALEQYQRAIDVDLGYAPAYYNMGILLERRAKYGEAERAYRKAILNDSEYLAAIENLANLALRLNDTKKAESILIDAIRRYPADLGLRNRLVAVWLASDKIDAAEVEAKKILKVDERNTGALVNLATVFYRRKQYELATSVLDRAREADPNEAKIWINLGFVYLAQGDKTKAAEAFARATTLRSDLPEAHNNLGALYVDAHDYEGAAKSLTQAIRLYPSFTKAYVNLGNAYKGLKKYAEAETAYKKALELDSNEVAPLFNLGVLHLDNLVPGTDRMKRWDIAKNYLEDYEKRARDLTPEEKQRVDAYIQEALRGQKREERRVESEKRGKRKSSKTDEPARDAKK